MFAPPRQSVQRSSAFSPEMTCKILMLCYIPKDSTTEKIMQDPSISTSSGRRPAVLLTALLIQSLIAGLLRLIPPFGDLAEARQLLTDAAGRLAAPEPEEGLLYLTLCLTAIPAVLLAWRLTEKLPNIRIHPVFALSAIPLAILSGWTGESTIPVCAAGLLLAGALAFSDKPFERRSRAAWPVWTAMGVAFVLTLARRIPCPARVEDLYGDHLHIVLYALNAVYHGLPDVHLYGFYPFFLAPVFRLTGLELLTAGLVLNALQLAAFWLVADAARRLIARIPALCGFLLAAVIFCGSASYLQTGNAPFDPYFACWPVRFLGPALAVDLISRREFPGRVPWSAVLSAGALWFNPETGLAVSGAFFAVYLLRGKFRSAACFAGLLFAALALWYALLGLLNGAPPDCAGYLAYLRDFWRAGYMMLPIRGTPVWLFPALILLGGLAAACRRLPIRRRDEPVLFLAVLGAGMFHYYIGRSYPGNLLAVSWPELLLFAIWTDRAGTRRSIRLAGFFPGCAAAALLLLRLPQIASDLRLQYRAFSAPSMLDAEAETIRRMTAGQTTVNLLPKHHQGILYAETGLKPGIRGFGLSECLFRREEARIFAELRQAPVPLIITDAQTLAPALQPYYRLTAVDPKTGIRLYLPISRRAAPIPRPPARP